MKRCLSLFLSIIMLLGIIGGYNMSAYADSSDYWYKVLDDGTAEIWNYAGSEADVTVPIDIDGYTVTSIGYPGFGSNSSLKSVSIPDTVTNIGSESFSNCQSLESITVDSNNQYYSSIDGALFNKDKTELLQYPIGNAEISYEIPEGVTAVNEHAFEYSTLLKNVIIPDSVKYINNSFNLCYGLETITVDSTSQYYSSRNGVLFSANETELIRYPISSPVTSYEIPESVTYIDYRAFYNCAALQNVIIPDSITYIGYQAFAFCTALTDVIIPASVDYVNSYAFMSCSALKTAIINEGVEQISSGAFSNCVNLTTMTIPASVTYIGNLAFSNCTGLKCVTVLNPGCTFAVCKNLIPPNSAMRGYENSTAQTYAQTYGRTFTAIDKYTVSALGGSIRLTDSGLRFGFSYDETQSENVEEYGFVYSYSQTNDLTLDTNGVKTAAANNRIDHGNYVTFNLVFTQIPQSAFDQMISARAYVKIDGEYYYSDILQRSFRSVANAVLADPSISQDIKDSINEMLG